ncbi:unnamed protein product [Calicophoron daubneyi]|uniref:Immunoglobulin-binding protein 1 n=1 Tax=Calicophoron daubneyi TaxID=300641 RepID=A0AAV2TR74_CALDB
MSDLPSLFSRALDEYTAVSNYSGSRACADFESQVSSASEACEKSVELINKLELFSKNEDIDDLSANEIKYMIVPALWGYFVSQKNTNRLDNIRVAITLYNEFNSLYASYFASESPPKDVNSTAAASREAKIRRYKEKRDLEDQLDKLATYINQPHVDEEVKREYSTKLVKRWKLIVEDELPILKKEEEILCLNPEEIKKQISEEKERPHVPVKPFILTRTALQAAVFGAGYPSLPTMTMDEFYEDQVKRGIFPAPKQQPLEQKSKPNVVRIDPSDSEKAAREEKAAKEDALEDAHDEEKLRKAREWDEFKDTHPRGSGNRMNRA